MKNKTIKAILLSSMVIFPITSIADNHCNTELDNLTISSDALEVAESKCNDYKCTIDTDSIFKNNVTTAKTKLRICIKKYNNFTY